MKRKIAQFVFSFGKGQLLGVITTAFAIFSMISPILSQNIVAVITSIITLLSVLILLYYLNGVNNKLDTLQILSNSRRPQAMRLLLAHDYLKYHPSDAGLEWKLSKLHATNAVYKYKVLPGSSNAQNFDLECCWSFEIKKPVRRETEIDLLLSQPRGEELRKVQY